MNIMQEWLARAASELGIEIKVGFVLTLAGNKTVMAQAYFPELGTAKGMLVFRSFKELNEAEQEINQQGYGISVFDEPLPNEEYETAGYAEMFEDWGWTGALEKKPAWML